MAKTKTKDITKFETWDIAQQAGQDITAALQEFAESRGLTLTFEKVSNVYDHEMSLSLKVNIIEATKAYNTGYANALERQAQMDVLAREEYIKSGPSLGLKPEWLGEEFFTNQGKWGTFYQVIGLRTGGKHPVVVVEKMKKEHARYIFKVPAVIKHFEIKAANVAAYEAREAAKATTASN